MVSWGIVSGLMIFVRSAEIFYLLRFILGMAEAGFFPGIILYLTYWFPSRRRGQMIALFMLAIAFTGVIGGPISGLIMGAFRDSQGLKAWQMLFLLEAIPSITIEFLVPLLLPNGVQSARWLSEREKAFLDQNIRTENRSKHHLTLRQVFAEPRIPLFCIVYFCSSAGLYGVAFWYRKLLATPELPIRWRSDCFRRYLTVWPALAWWHSGKAPIDEWNAVGISRSQLSSAQLA